MSSPLQFNATDAATAAASSPPALVASHVQSSSGSEGDPHSVVDDRKRKRMISNRESARRSRMRKQQHLDELLGQVTLLQTENNQMVSRIDAAAQQYQGIDGENAVLRAQVNELTERLQYLNSVLHFLEDFSGMAMDIPEIPDPLLKPWQLPCPPQPIFASADMLQY
ncbi:bZIP transcription factor 53 [Nymphaea thermarum]|nr:bZIP transcription factor 53 [Nymphaea thermarum]